MADSNFEIEYAQAENAADFSDVVKKYFKYWPWFLLVSVISLGLGFIYMRYAPITYKSVAKIEILDESESINIPTNALSLLGGASTVNMDNEVEILRSYRILRQVVEALNLDVSYFIEGNVKTTEIWNPPFAITKLVAEDSLESTQSYGIIFNGQNITLTDDSGYSENISLLASEPGASGYPFDIALRPDANTNEFSGLNYRVVLTPIKQAVFNLSAKLQVEPIDENSEILELSILGESVERSESILNELINKFNQDGIEDRRLVSKRTLDFIDERFVSLSEELDSIELGKEDFKQANQLSYIESDADFSLQQRAVAEDEVTQLETQVSLANLLKKSVMDQSDFGLIPMDVGLENSGVNTLVGEYNQLAIQRDKLVASVGENHPTLVALNGQLRNAKVNILKTINVYQTQLRLSLRQLNREKSRVNSMFSALPEKEKMLRAIERQQSIKENLFILLLQKREEAALSYAVTAPSIKVVDYALTPSEPLSPKGRIVYPMSLMLGMFVPFIFLYLRFTLTNKLEGRPDLAKISPDIPVLGEIPTARKGKEILHVADRSVMAESIRILSTNLEYHLPEKEEGKARCVLVTSSVKGEGKTTVALNLALAYAGMNKKVLLVGSDLRNPGLEDYFNPEDFSYGLSEYLSDTRVNWKECVATGLRKNRYLNICFGGKIPENPTQLLSEKRFSRFIEEASGEYEVIILDSAPCMSVADTLLISRQADATLYVTRVGYTDKNLIKYARDLNQNNQLPQMAYILNDMGSLKARKY